MSRRQRKEKKGKDDGGAPGWMTTYGDMMSLLLAFFILIVSFSSIREEEFKKAMASLQKAMGLLRSEMSVVKTINPDTYRPSNEEVRELIHRLREQMGRIPEVEKNISFETTDDGVRVRISNPLLFDLGKANLKPGIYPILDEIAVFLESADASFPVVVEGHTDNIPIHNEEFRSNWELSAARSVAVVEYFIGVGLHPQRCSAVAYGEYQPLVANDTDANRSKNRRVEIFIPYHRNLPQSGVVN